MTARYRQIGATVKGVNAVGNDGTGRPGGRLLNRFECGLLIRFGRIDRALSKQVIAVFFRHVVQCAVSIRHVGNVDDDVDRALLRVI